MLTQEQIAFIKEQYQNGKSLSCIHEDIMLSYQKNAPIKNIDISFFTEFKQLKDRIIFKLINYERNKELLSKVPHIRYLDLAIVFYLLLETTEKGGIPFATAAPCVYPAARGGTRYRDHVDLHLH